MSRPSKSLFLFNLNRKIITTSANLYNRRTFPKNFKIEFYAKNLNKKEEDSATLDKIGSIVYNDDAEAGESTTNFSNNDLNNFILKPQSVIWIFIY